jgi:hypothetical protein
MLRLVLVEWWLEEWADDFDRAALRVALARADAADAAAGLRVDTAA